MAEPEVARAVSSYQTTIAALRARVEAFVARAWNGLADYRDANIDQFVARVVPVVTGGQRQVAALTDAYLAQVATLVLDGTTRAAGVASDSVSSDALRGVPADEVYRRPGVTVWTKLSQGSPLTEAVAAGLARAVDLAGTDLQLAKTHTARNLMAGDDRIVGYRRILEGRKSCGLCIVASTQRYRTGDLLPIHGRCDCSVIPIYGRHDPGHIIDPDTLEGVHQTLADRFGAADPNARSPVDYRAVLVTHEHGELGPILAVRGQDFTGTHDI